METLPSELWVLTCLAVLAASLWIPYIIGVSKQGAGFEAFARPGDLSALPAWVHRAHRAHLNLLEQLLPFAILALILDRIDGFNMVTYWAVVAFFWLRVAHAVGMISGLARMPLRPILFVLGWVCCLVLGAQVLLAA